MIERFLKPVVSAVFAAIIVLLLVEILCRAFLDLSITWAEPASRAGLLWLTFLGSVIGIGKMGFVSFTFFDEALADSHRKILRIFLGLLTTIFLLALFWSGVLLVLNTFDERVPGLNLSAGYVFLAVPIGAALMLVEIWRNARR